MHTSYLYTTYMSVPYIHTYFTVWSFVHITFATNVMGKMPVMLVKEPLFIITQIVLGIFITYLFCVKLFPIFCFHRE